MGCVAGGMVVSGVCGRGMVVSGVCGRGRGGEWGVWQGAWL